MTTAVVFVSQLHSPNTCYSLQNYLQTEKYSQHRVLVMPTVRPRTTIYLWEFLLQLLDGEEDCAAISWVNRERGEFVLKDQSEIAKLWGRVKGRPRMDKIKLGRAMRYYYKKKLLAKVNTIIMRLLLYPYENVLSQKYARTVMALII